MENKKEINNQLLLNLLVLISKLNQSITSIMDYNNNLELDKELWSPDDYKKIQEDLSNLIYTLFSKLKELDDKREEIKQNETMRENGTDDSEI